MNDTERTCLAITKKKAQRPGGFVGIFFQLFDWNTRFAKKKLFSMKLLPATPAKQPSKKFGGDGKRPQKKLHTFLWTKLFVHLKRKRKKKEKENNGFNYFFWLC
ncbi:hypothetical protein NC653_014165 [Populus alba x Populus x berolinensis]|uniref:Uncharacterized protein n=1 Tax=Populus alba x Populus x berolinensis TaxID=444605 RepID=A0AAD6W3G7_9ROSI|nr:hypothetical protein NC653_014165 [Populus alba x Populus x berolinensis]